MKYVKLLIIIVVLVFIVLFLRAADLDKVAASLRQVGYNFIWLILISFFSYMAGTIAWRYCMGSEGKKIPLLKLFIIRHVGETVGVVNPTSIVAGEAVKVYLLRNHTVPTKMAITSVLLSRVLMILTQIVVFLAAAIYCLWAGGITLFVKPNGNILFIFLVISAVILVAIKYKALVKRYLLSTKAGRQLSIRTVKIRGQISEAIAELKTYYFFNKKALLMAVIFFMLHWVIGSLEFFVILKLLGVAVQFINVIFVDMSVILFKSAGAFIPAQVGVEEYGNKVMLAAIGIPALEIWVSASILRRARLLFWIIFGMGAYFYIDRKKNNILQPDGNSVCKP